MADAGIPTIGTYTNILPTMRFSDNVTTIFYNLVIIPSTETVTIPKNSQMRIFK